METGPQAQKGGVSRTRSHSTLPRRWKPQGPRLRLWPCLVPGSPSRPPGPSLWPVPSGRQALTLAILRAVTLGHLLHSCVEMLIKEQMRKYKVKMEEINQLEAAESIAFRRLSLLRQNTVSRRGGSGRWAGLGGGGGVSPFHPLHALGQPRVHG